LPERLIANSKLRLFSPKPNRARQDRGDASGDVLDRVLLVVSVKVERESEVRDLSHKVS
jgi:hypothetical protein